MSSSRRAMFLLVIVSLVLFAFMTAGCGWGDIVKKEVEVINAPVASDTRPLCQNVLEIFRDEARKSGACKD